MVGRAHVFQVAITYTHVSMCEKKEDRAQTLPTGAKYILDIIDLYLYIFMWITTLAKKNQNSRNDRWQVRRIALLVRAHLSKLAKNLVALRILLNDTVLSDYDMNFVRVCVCNH